MARYIEACGYRHLVVNNQLYFDRLSVLMLLSGSRNIYWFSLGDIFGCTEYQCIVAMRERFQRLHKRGSYIETNSTINGEAANQDE